MDTAQWRNHIVVTLLIGAMFHLAVALLIFGEMPQTEDGPSYRAQALSILDGNQGYFFFPPGTAIAALPWYAVLGRSLTVDHLIATFFWVAFSASSAWLAWYMCSDKRAAWIASLMASFLPHSLLATGTISSQPLTAALLAGSICIGVQAYHRGSLLRWGIACLVLAAAVVVRPATLAITACVGFIVIWAWFRRGLPPWTASRALGLLIITHVVLLLPIMKHNSDCGQGYAISTNNEWNLLVGNNPYTPDYKTGHFGQRTFDKLPEDARTYLTRILPHQKPAFATHDERQNMRDTALRYMADHPLRTLYRITNRFRGFWGMDYTASRELQNTYRLSGLLTTCLLLIEGGSFVIVLLLTLFYMFAAKDRMHKPLSLIVIGASLAPYLMAFTVAKYHTVVLPVLFPLSAMGWVWITSHQDGVRTLKKEWKKLSVIALIIVLIQMEHIYHIVDNH